MVRGHFAKFLLTFYLLRLENEAIEPTPLQGGPQQSIAAPHVTSSEAGGTVAPHVTSSEAGMIVTSQACTEASSETRSSVSDNILQRTPSTVKNF
jgi:hypothetical protein